MLLLLLLPNAETAPAAPSGLTATPISPTRIDLAWVDNSDNETSFSVLRSPSALNTFSTIASVAANATSYSDTSCLPSTAYDYYVMAVNGAGTSLSELALAATPAASGRAGIYRALLGVG